MEGVTEQSAHEVARGLMRLGDLDGASKIAEAEIQRLGDKSYTTELWRLRFIRAEVIDAHAAISYYQRALAMAREIKDPVSIKKWTHNINLAYARIRQSVDQTNPRIA